MRFIFFILDLDQYIDEIDFCWIIIRCCANILPLIPMCNMIWVLDY